MNVKVVLLLKGQLVGALNMHLAGVHQHGPRPAPEEGRKDKERKPEHVFAALPFG